MTDLQTTIRDLLREADIEGYIELDAPADEYDDEADMIALALKELTPENFDVEHVETIMGLIWEDSFDLSEQDMDLRQPRILKLAQKIVA